MSKYQLKPRKMGKAVVKGYKKVEDAFVDAFLEQEGDGGRYKLKTSKLGQTVVEGYHKVEEGVVGGYKKIEDAFVERFLERADDPAAAPATGTEPKDDAK